MGAFFYLGALGDCINCIYCSAGLGERHAKGKSLRSNVFRLALWSSAYHIWQQRNGVLHQGRIYVEENILHLIKWEVRRRIEGNGNFTNSVQNRV